MVKMVNVMLCVFCLKLETTCWSKYHQVNVRDGYDDLGDRPPSLLVNPALPMGSCAQVGAGVNQPPDLALSPVWQPCFVWSRPHPRESSVQFLYSRFPPGWKLDLCRPVCFMYKPTCVFRPNLSGPLSAEFSQPVK